MEKQMKKNVVFTLGWMQFNLVPFTLKTVNTEFIFFRLRFNIFN